MSFLLHVIFLIGMRFPSVLGHNLIFGKGKILHFGPIGVAIVAAYGVVLTINATGSFFLGFLAGLLGASLVSLLFAWLSFRLDADGFGVMSIAVHLAIIAVVLNWTSLTRGALGIPRIPRLPIFHSTPTLVITTMLLGALWIVFMLYLDRSSFGRKLQALAEHEWHSKALGISRVQVHTLAFLIGGVGWTIIEFLYLQYIGILHPNDYLFPVLILYVTFVVAGGPGNVWGVVLAIAVLVSLQESLRFLPIPIHLKGPLILLLFGVILFAAVWYRRKELFPVQRTI